MKRAPFVVPTLGTRRSPRAFAISVAVHILAVVVLSIVLVQHPLARIIGLRAAKPAPQERINYIRVAPAAGVIGADTGAARARAPAATPAPRGAPRAGAPAAVPEGVTPSPPADLPGAVRDGTGGGGGAGGTGAGTGMVPSYSDSRVWATPGDWIALPKSQRQVVDSVIDVAVGAYIDSVAVAAANKVANPATGPSARVTRSGASIPSGSTSAR